MGERNSPLLCGGLFYFEKETGMIRPVQIQDARELCEIYNYYIENSPVTFEEVPVSEEEMKMRIKSITEKYPWLVWEQREGITGYAYLNLWKERSAYRFSAEDTVYLKTDCEGKGIGSALLSGLINQTAQTGIHAIVAGITLPNEKSVGLHEKMGFRKIAHFSEIGKKFGEWLDVGYWELIL
ncbi:N-acetyltransferase family protein [Brucepastera parasyntrophica]|uniref:GNAT family N-acetyltransferase n=1 Tax=Brucepastera parasyntrophica TaxID=2880008 RepID=UPI00210DBB65|nr:GNAT family N-acetyltransferase [Brucepastera parasyntrophica]ULQ59162.1 N-acetyltransferase family protein [Brucepastera parasyntrophica]